MKRNAGILVAVLCVFGLTLAATLLSADTEKDMVSEALAAPAAPQVEDVVAASSQEDSVLQPEEETEEEVVPVTPLPSITPIPTPAEPVVESGGDENHGCIGDDGLVW